MKPPSKIAIACAAIMLLLLAVKQPGYGKFAIISRLSLPSFAASLARSQSNGGGSKPNNCPIPKNNYEALLTKMDGCAL